MSIAQRSATTIWEGSLSRGTGTITGQTGALRDLDVTWAGRTAAPEGKTSPEELAAAAHSSCFAMALALRLSEAQRPPQRLEVTGETTLDGVDGLPTIVSSHLTVMARVDGLDYANFRQILDEAIELCPVSRLFAGAHIEVDAVLLEET